MCKQTTEMLGGAAAKEPGARRQGTQGGVVTGGAGYGGWAAFPFKGCRPGLHLMLRVVPR